MKKLTQRKIISFILAAILTFALIPSITVSAADATITIKELVKPTLQFDEVRDFSEGLAAVCKNNKWGFVDKNGKQIVSCTYDAVGYFDEGLAAVCKNGKWGFVDKNGKQIVSCTYDMIGDFSEGLALVAKAIDGKDIDGNGLTYYKYGYVDKTGKLVISLQFIANDIQIYSCDFKDGLAMVQNDNGKHGFIDKTGKLVVSYQYDWAFNFKEGFAPVGKNGKMGFIDKTGKLVVSCQYDWTFMFSEGLALVRNDNGKYGFIDKTGKLVVSCQYDGAASYFSEGLEAVEKNRKWGFIDKTGKLVVSCQYDYAGDFSGGLAVVEKNGKYGFIDKTGKLVVSCQYDNATDFKDGRAIVTKDGFSDFIDTTGKKLSSISQLNNDLTLYNFNEGIAVTNIYIGWNQFAPCYVDKNGEYVWGTITMYRENGSVLGGDGNVYDELRSFNGGIAWTKYNNKYGIVEAVKVQPLKAIPASSKVSVNGKSYTVPAYNIDGNNYYKIRDLAYIISSGAKGSKIFDVAYNSKTGNTEVKTNAKYKVVSGELAKGTAGNKTPVQVKSNIVWNGKGTNFTLYNIDGNNYVKLRDVMQMANIYVGYDSKTNAITLDTNKGYVN